MKFKVHSYVILVSFCKAITGTMVISHPSPIFSTSLYSYVNIKRMVYKLNIWFGSLEKCWTVSQVW